MYSNNKLLINQIYNKMQNKNLMDVFFVMNNFRNH